MTTPFFSLEQMDADHKIEHDWLFEKLLGKLDSLRNIILMAEQGWGIQDYASGWDSIWPKIMWTFKLAIWI